jgi:immune inhibitor A
MSHASRFTAAGIAVASALGLASPRAMAAPAAPNSLEFVQPNGESVTVRQWGDENVHGFDDSQGYAVGYNEKTRRWNYLRQDTDGKLTDSNVPVRGKPKNAGPDFQLPGTVPEGLPKNHRKHLRPARANELIQHGADSPFAGPSLASGAAAAAGTAGPSAAASTSATPVTFNIPVILVNFSNTTTTNTPAEFDTLLFGTGATDYSMKQYYEEASYGQFTVSPGTNGIAGWYNAPNTHDYYGTNNPSLGNIDSHAAVLVYQAVQGVDASVDFSQYDRNGDCWVDTVMIVHQGKGEEASGVSTDIWSHSWDLTSAKLKDPAVPNYYYTTRDTCKAKPTTRVKVSNYTIEPERYGSGISTIGVYTHEFGHALGLPDLYDTDNSSYGIGRWSLMSYGTWNGVSRNGDRPAHFDAWSKLTLGWTTPVQITGSWPGQTVNPAYGTGDVFQVVRASAPSEYYLIENRQKAGFDAGLPSAGLLVWHVDASKADNTKECYPGGPSCASQHYKVALVGADNLWNLEKRQNQGDGGDPFPGTYGVSSFNGGTAPNSNWYNGSASGFGIGGITVNPDGTITADFSAP